MSQIQVGNGEVYAPPAAPRYRTFAPFADADLAALEDAHGRIEVVTGATPPPSRWRPDDKPEPPWEAVFRVPTEGELTFFERAAGGSEQAKASGLRNLVKAIVVGVSLGGKQTMCLGKSAGETKATRDAWEALREKHPAAHIAAQDSAMSLAGMGRDEGKGG